MFTRKKIATTRKKPPSRVEAASALAVLSVTTWVAGCRERNAYLRLHAVVSASLGFIVSILVAMFGPRSWLRIPVTVTFITSLVANRRLLQNVSPPKQTGRWWKRTWVYRALVKFVSAFTRPFRKSSHSAVR